VEPNQWTAEPPIVRVLADEVLWYSQRDGWGHLYRYDLRTGALGGQVTSGQWAVRQILHVDEAERVVYFTASGLVEEDPYRRTVCRVGLDGSGFAKVTDDGLDHIVTMPDTMERFIDSASTVDTPPVTTVRDWSGRVLVELERADITKLTATGWTPPGRFCVKAADGVTDIYGVLYRPGGVRPRPALPGGGQRLPRPPGHPGRPVLRPRRAGPRRGTHRGAGLRGGRGGRARHPRAEQVLPRRLLRPPGRRGLPGRPCRVRKRCWDFLVCDLMGTQPPTYRPAPIAIDPALLGELFA
jgi:dipeptidyl-peptidase-4